MSKTKSTRKELSPQQRHALLTTLKARLETNMKRHKGLEWTKLQAKLEANTFSMTAPPRVRKNAGVFAMTAKRWQRAKKTSRKTARLIWRRLWASSF